METLVREFLLQFLLITIAGLSMTQEVRSATTGCPKDLPHTTEMKRFGDVCYQFVSEEKYWYDARRYCLQNGGRLVKIGDSETNSFIVRTLNSLWWKNNGVWIGLHDTYREMQFQWTGYRIYENEALGPWTNWGRGHPGAFLHSLRDCVRMVRENGQWKWHETPCNSLKWHYRFICEYTFAKILEAPAANQPGVQLTLRGDKPMADNKMLEKTTRSPRSTTAPANSPRSEQSTAMTTEEQTSEIELIESTQRSQFDGQWTSMDEEPETQQELNSFTTQGVVDSDESVTSFREDELQFTEEELEDEAAAADRISFEEEEEPEMLYDTNGSDVRMALSISFALVATCAILLAACIVYRSRRQQKQVTSDITADDKEDKENKMAERNQSSGPKRAVGNIYFVAGPSDLPQTSSAIESPETSAGNHLPTFDDEAPLGHHQTDDCGEQVVAGHDGGSVAGTSDLYDEIADEEQTTEAVDHIYESLDEYVA